MDGSTRATAYDLFKSIVAIILLILFFLLNWKVTPQSPTPTSTPNPTTIPSSSTSTSLTSTLMPSDTSTGTSIAISTQSPLASPTTTPIAVTTTDTALPSPTSTNIVTTTATPLPTPTATPVIQSTSTHTPETPISAACDAASSRSRLQTGMSATILRRLNFRSSPGIRDNWLLTNIPGTKVEVVGGPECVPHLNGAYVWWQIKLPDGRIGWSAEGSLFGGFYFMEPSP
jgi:cytoskeletal protein RodZ